MPRNTFSTGAVAFGNSELLRVPRELPVPHTLQVVVSGGATATVSSLTPEDDEIVWDNGDITASTEEGRYSPAIAYKLTVTVAGSATLHLVG